MQIPNQVSRSQQDTGRLHSVSCCFTEYTGSVIEYRTANRPENDLHVLAAEAFGTRLKTVRLNSAIYVPLTVRLAVVKDDVSF